MFVRHYHHFGGHVGWGPGFWLFAVGLGLLVVLLVVLIVLALRSRAGHGAHPLAAPGGGSWGGPAPTARPPGQEAERILAERYARGELDDEEYQRRLRTLREPPGGDG
ncbi:SHOCT domain-containing protein [Kitasatospora viridis]|uniref:Putative membrane protein n=1 Tax=Kitasatospora viridis TaxID=281105 RepID=A0A561UPF9_9ACTN|nr:SHOCT domain-containing protein [Kitasatospora viridis]TWG01258.1 putative membrane protein [Kitasatospora viridis]